MSMLSAQCDELRAMAESVGLAMPQAATLMMDAADTIWELRDDLQRANAAVRDAEHEESCAWDRVRKAEVVATKLRELVRDMYACISHANEQDWFYFERDKLGCGMSCTVNGEVCGLCTLADRMHKLGIEVDE